MRVFIFLSVVMINIFFASNAKAGEWYFNKRISGDHYAYVPMMSAVCQLVKPDGHPSMGTKHSNGIYFFGPDEIFVRITLPSKELCEAELKRALKADRCIDQKVR